MKKINKKILFIPGLGEQAKNYKFFPAYINIYNVDWNNLRLPRGKIDVLIGFSMGAALACEYAEINKVETLILCSLTPAINTLETIKAKNVIFIVGENEKWAYENNKRLAKTLKCKAEIVVVKKGRHKINRPYLRVIENIINTLDLS